MELVRPRLRNRAILDQFILVEEIIDDYDILMAEDREGRVRLTCWPIMSYYLALAYCSRGLEM